MENITNLHCEIQSRSQGGVLLLLTGRLDSSTVPAFDTQVEEVVSILQVGQPLVVDFGRVTYISSMGIRSLLKARKALQVKGSALSMIHMQPQVASVLQMANLYF